MFKIEQQMILEFRKLIIVLKEGMRGNIYCRQNYEVFFTVVLVKLFFVIFIFWFKKRVFFERIVIFVFKEDLSVFFFGVG